ncbi:hypothetical protein ACVWWO_006397 [Bradyrhizobium sp. F1.13.1]
MGCHNHNHFDDVAIQRGRFDRNYQGTNEHDVVAAINAAVAMLLNRPSPSAFNVAIKAETLFFLAHLIGDLHHAPFWLQVRVSLTHGAIIGLAQFRLW